MVWGLRWPTILMHLNRNVFMNSITADEGYMKIRAIWEIKYKKKMYVRSSIRKYKLRPEIFKLLCRLRVRLLHWVLLFVLYR